MGYLSSACAIWLGSMFAYTAAAKLIRYEGWERALKLYRIEPGPILGAIAVAIPTLELGVAVGIFVPASRHAAAPLASALGMVFVVAALRGKQLGRANTCACSGKETPTRLAVTLVRAAGISASGILLFFEHGHLGSASEAGAAFVLAALLSSIALRDEVVTRARIAAARAAHENERKRQLALLAVNDASAA